MSKVYVRTNANNAEKTIGRAIESVLNQTYTDLLYYINDNGSTDNTRKIIEEYAANDSRIIPFYNKINRVYEDDYIRCNFCELTEIIDDNDFLCYLDADDEYSSSFLEDVLEFMQQYNLDIGCCGSNILSVKKGNSIVGTRKVSVNLIVEGRDFATLFPIYHQFARAVWGKIYRGSTLRGRVLYDDPNDFTFPNYGSDTVNTLKAFSKANKVGILAKTLHNYFLSDKSDSYNLDPKRVISDQLQHKFTLEYLKELGSVSESNFSFLYEVYCNAIIDTFNVVISSRETEEMKMKLVADICKSEITYEMMYYDKLQSKSKDELLEQIYKWLSNNKVENTMFYSVLINILNYRFGTHYKELNEEFVSVLYKKTTLVLDYIIMDKMEFALKILNTNYKSICCDYIELRLLKIILLHKLKYNITEVIEECTDFLLEFSNNVFEDIVINIALKNICNNPILNKVSHDFYKEYFNLAKYIVKNDYISAFQIMYNELRKNTIDNRFARQFFLIGQNIASILGDQDAYLLFKKLTIDFLIDINSFKEAREELSDFAILLPDDVDFRKIKKILD